LSRPVVIQYRSPNAEPEPPEGEGKFLQLVWRGQEYLAFAPSALHRYHNQLLAHFLQDQGIPHRWVTEQDLEFGHPRLAVKGGGRYRVNTSQKTLRLWDDSRVYGRFHEIGLPEKIAAAGHPWSNFKVIIA
jgi:hypothetical protein